ncbi:hypothetical protein [Caminibacter pacificus]|uniref:Uncharacterized protein n=1 Tax=Caminibacter pacificus TaxID=1424653 RepID=A0AAJ4RCF6_9BACT|nr:hypothetical protein [Caminibacter pacificus]QCI27911.1 hypothetical protein C6V80_02690 [Caminibacter pacificus]ROR39911.1 hypothetical protein EDC58_0890 [Caminibacter pacificus]
MKKVIILLFFSVVLLFASAKIELFEKLFSTLFQKPVVYVLTNNPDIKNANSRVLIVVKSCKKADVIIGDVDKNCTKPRFLLDYYKFKNNKNAIGAFYWRKGRPQLRLRKKELEKYHLYISKEFEDFLE